MRPGHPLSRGQLNLDKYCRAEHALVSVSGGLFQGSVDAQLAVSGLDRFAGGADTGQIIGVNGGKTAL